MLPFCLSNAVITCVLRPVAAVWLPLCAAQMFELTAVFKTCPFDFLSIEFVVLTELYSKYSIVFIITAVEALGFLFLDST